MHQFRITFPIALVEQVQHIFLELLTVLIYIFPCLACVSKISIKNTRSTGIPSLHSEDPPLSPPSLTAGV